MSAELIEIFREAARDSIIEWTRRFPADNGDNIRVRYFEDGTAEVERETETGFETVRVYFGVAAVEVPKEENKPTGFKIHRPWRQIPAGWFVTTPDGKRFEVLASKANGAFQDVTLRFPDGRSGTWPRPADGDVLCQRGTHTKALDEAIDHLAAAFGPVEVLDSPPWDE